MNRKTFRFKILWILPTYGRKRYAKILPIFLRALQAKRFHFSFSIIGKSHFYFMNQFYICSWISYFCHFKWLWKFANVLTTLWSFQTRRRYRYIQGKKSIIDSFLIGFISSEFSKTPLNNYVLRCTLATNCIQSLTVYTSYSFIALKEQ